MGLKRDEVRRKWRRLRNEELHNLYSPPNIIREIKSRKLRWEGHVTRMKERRSAYMVLVTKPEGKNHLLRPRHREEDNIRIYI